VLNLSEEPGIIIAHSARRFKPKAFKEPPMKKTLFAVKQKWYPTIFREADMARLRRVSDVLPVPPPAQADKAFLLAHAREAEVVVTTWETAALDAEVIAAAPKLELVVHAAGSIRPIVSEALWARGVKVSSMAAAISFGVAEFCLGQFLMGGKRAYWAAQGTRAGQWGEGVRVFDGPHELYGQNVGVIGAGHVGRHLIRLLRNFTCNIHLYDPYTSAERAREMGAVKVESLDDLFATCLFVALCAPSTPETQGMVRGRHFARLPKGAVFVNAARGAITDEGELVEELRKGRFVACLDVTVVEPTPAEHPLRSLPNVVLTPHIAGVVAENRFRIGAMACDEIIGHCEGRGLQYGVTQEQLARMA
jgi:phosphoglycerate dehydrogenase-like enzyme